MNTFKKVFFVILTSAVLAQTGCDQGISSQQQWADLDAEMVSRGTMLPGSNEKTLTDRQEEVAGDYLKVTRTYRDEFSLTSITELGTGNGTIAPGILLNGDKAAKGILAPIVGKRKPMPVFIDLEGVPEATDTDLFLEVDPQVHLINQGIRNIISSVVTNGNVPARIMYTEESIHSEEELSKHIGASIKWAGTGSIKSSYDFDSKVYNSHFFAKIEQVYFKACAPFPGPGLSSFFSSEEDPEKIKDQVSGPGLYVSSVSYGRMAFIMIDSQHSEIETKRALSAAYNFVSGDASATFSSTEKEVLDTCKIKAVFYGGSAPEALDVSGAEAYVEFLEYVKSGAHFTPESSAVPISYQLNHVIDGSLASINLCSEYTISDYLLPNEASLSLVNWVGGSKADKVIDVEMDLISLKKPESPVKIEFSSSKNTGGGVFEYGPEEFIYDARDELYRIRKTFTINVTLSNTGVYKWYESTINGKVSHFSDVTQKFIYANYSCNIREWKRKAWYSIREKTE